MRKTIIVLTKSFKHGNYCIAGIDINTGEWVRPVSNYQNIEGAVLIQDATYDNGNQVELFDVVTINFIGHYPKPCQRENYLYDSNKKWFYVRKSSLQEVLSIINQSNINYIFENNSRALNDSEITGQSLMLVKIQNPAIWVKTFERKRLTISFTYNNNDYSFISVSDINLFNAYKTYPDGKYSLGMYRYAVFSLTGRYKDGNYYKMLAQLF